MARRRAKHRVTSDADPGGRQLSRIANLASAIDEASERERKGIQEVGKLFERMALSNGADPDEVRDIAFKLQRSMARNRTRTKMLLRHLNSLNDEISRLHDALKEKIDEAHRDPLTGLPNRRALDQRIIELSDQECAVLIADLDHFKRINDTYGHDAGDKVLCAVAQTLRANVREKDFVARLGGEEFIVLLPGVRGDGAARVAEKIRGKIESVRFTRRGGESLDLKVTTSIGLAVRGGGEDLRAAMERADAALYAAKESGRNQVATDQPVTVNSGDSAESGAESTKTGVFLRTAWGAP